jgi:hypothetical protein
MIQFAVKDMAFSIISTTGDGRAKITEAIKCPVKETLDKPMPS